MTHLALRTTKATAQAIGWSMSILVVLECHLWLTLTEMKEKDKVPFLDAPVSSNSLFGPAVEGFAERFTEAQKSSQAMNFYAMHGCSSLPSATDGNPHPQLPRRLAHSGPVRGSFNIAQDPAPPPLNLPGAQGQLFQEHTVTQPMSIIPGDSYRLSADDNNCLSGASYDD